MNNIIIIGIALLCFSETTFAEDINAQGPYCGIHAIYSAKIILSGDANLVDLYKPEYISSSKGSSINDLTKAAFDNGLYIKPIKNLSVEDLSRTLPNLTILHVKPDLQSKYYNHYVLFLGIQDGKAQIFNPPNRMSLVSFAEIEARWDGVGMIVSNEPIDLGTVFASARRRFIIYAAIAISAILALHWAKRLLPETLLNSRIKLMGLSITQAAGFAILALLVGVFYHFADDAGLLANAKATSAIQQAHAANFIPKIGEKKIHKLLGSDTVFIDARFARDFKAGHLEGAINLPVDANDVEHQKVTDDIVKDARIVLYCQSAGCKFAETVAIKLVADGFSNISVFRGGWNEWVAKNGKKKEVGI